MPGGGGAAAADTVVSVRVELSVRTHLVTRWDEAAKRQRPQSEEDRVKTFAAYSYKAQANTYSLLNLAVVDQPRWSPGVDRVVFETAPTWDLLIVNPEKPDPRMRTRVYPAAMERIVTEARRGVVSLTEFAGTQYASVVLADCLCARDPAFANACPTVAPQHRMAWCARILRMLFALGYHEIAWWCVMPLVGQFTTRVDRPDAIVHRVSATRQVPPTALEPVFLDSDAREVQQLVRGLVGVARHYVIFG